MKYTFICFILVGVPLQLMADVYQWRDNEGVLHFSDERPDAVLNVTTIKTKQPAVIPSKSLTKNKIIERAKKITIQKRAKQKIIKPKHRKSQLTIIKDNHVDEKKHDDEIESEFKKVTGFNSADQLDIARARCNSVKNSDCSTKTLIKVKLLELRAYSNATPATRVNAPKPKAQTP